jgi:hypothetical protein
MVAAGGRAVSAAVRVNDAAAPDFASLQTRVLAPGFPWHYARATREDDGQENPWLRSWVHMVYDHGNWYSQDGQFILSQILATMAAVGEPIANIFRIRIVLNTITDQPYLNGAHVDFVWPHKTALLYLDDADGDTVIYQERWEGERPQAFTVSDQVAPAANRLVLFDGQRFHTGTTPTRTARRVVLNVNYD